LLLLKWQQPKEIIFTLDADLNDFDQALLTKFISSTNTNFRGSVDLHFNKSYDNYEEISDAIILKMGDVR